MICYVVRKLKNDVYWDWLVTKNSWMAVIFQSYNLLNEHQWNNYLQIIWDYVLFHSQICKYGRNGLADKWTFKKRTKDIHLWTFRKPPILVQLGNPKKHSILNLLWGFTYECSMYLHINSRKHENISLPFNHCFCGVCCLEILKIKHWRH